MRDLSWLTARPIAHRGLHDASAGLPENTLAAARAALEGGYGIECDVQLTADGEAVVFHDFTLDRLTSGSGRVDARRADELAGIRISGTRETIPSLTDLLRLIGGKVPLVVEVKSAFDGDLRLATRTATVIASYPGPLAVKSFDPRIVEALRGVVRVPRGIVAMDEDGYREWRELSPADRRSCANLLHFSQTEPDFLSWRVRDLPSAAPFLCRTQLGRPVMTWTVRTPEDRRRAAEHADQMVFESFRP